MSGLISARNAMIFIGSSRLLHIVSTPSRSSDLPTPAGPGSVSGAPNLPAGFTGTFTSRYVRRRWTAPARGHRRRRPAAAAGARLAAGAGKQMDCGSAVAMAAQSGDGEGFTRSPAEFVQEGKHCLGRTDRLQAGEGLGGHRDLDLVQHRVVGAWQPLAGQLPRGRACGCRRAAERADRLHDGGPGQGDLANSTAVPVPGSRYGITCGQYRAATCSAISRVCSSAGARPAASL
jgi:hypothetical protein